MDREYFEKCIEVADDLNEEIGDVEDLNTMFYFTVETHGCIDSSIKFMGDTMWDTENYDPDMSAAEIKEEIKSELKSVSKLLNGLVGVAEPDVKS